MTARHRNRRDPQGGQATLEYVGMVLLVAALFAVFAAIAGPSLPGGGIARALADGLLCAVGSSDRCHGSEPGTAVSPTVAAYGHEIAAMLDRSAPDIFFEADDFVSLPVDFRDCRERRCADTVRAGSVHATQTGLPPVAFTHVIDCRRAPAPASRPAGGYDCSGARAGHVYLQYWLYYPDSLTHGLGRVGGFHLDDWESYQTRIDGDGSAAARASSHHGYNGRQGGISSIGSDTGWSPHPGWDSSLNTLHVASGSHAGTTGAAYGDSRAIHREDLVLIPAEPIASSAAADFAVSPPWRKEVWRDPEAMGT